MSHSSVARPTLQFTLRRTLVIITVLGVALAILVGPVRSFFLTAREASQRIDATNQVKQIVLALHNYHDAYGSVPPPVTRNKHDEEMCSWRFTIIPFMTQTGSSEREGYDENQNGVIDLNPFAEYNRDFPWNEPANLGFLQQMGFECFYTRPGARNQVSAATNFVLVTGPGTLFPDEGPLLLSDITDGTSKTVLLVEIDRSDIPWYEPRDLRIDAMSFRINDPDRSLPSIGNRRARGAIVGYADGSVEFLEENTRPAALRALLTIAAGD